MLKLASFILGALLLTCGTIGCFMLAGNSPSVLFLLVPALAMFLIPVGCSTLAFGLGGPLIVLRAFAASWNPGHAKMAEAAPTISACIGYVYGAGGFVFLASLLTCLSSFSVSGFSQSLTGNIAGTIVSLIYTVVLAELVLRPLKHRLAAITVR